MLVLALDDVRSDLGVDPADDQGRVVRVGRERCRGPLRAGRSSAFNATDPLRQARRRWVDLFAGCGARVEVVYAEPPLPTVLARNRRRERPVPGPVIPRLAARCEPPTLTEAHGVLLDPGPARG